MHQDSNTLFNRGLTLREKSQFKSFISDDVLGRVPESKFKKN
jgi:hypothetical protein